MPGRVTPKKEKDPLVMLQEGVYVERDVLNVVQKIHDYDPNLKVKFLDPDKFGDVFESPYILVETLPDGSEQAVMSIWELNDSILELIVGMDLARRHHATDFLTEMDKVNAAAEKEQKRLQKEKDDAIQELVSDVLKSPKDTYSAINPVSGEKHEFRSVPKSED